MRQKPTTVHAMVLFPAIVEPAMVGIKTNRCEVFDGSLIAATRSSPTFSTRLDLISRSGSDLPA